MINNYEIRNKNGIEILYIYLDYNSEFAKLNSKKSNRKIKSEIKKYIKNNKIDFKGTTVAIMVGGLMIGTIMLNKPSNKSINYRNDNNIIAILSDYDNGDELLKDDIVEIEILDVEEHVNKKTIEKDKETIKNEISNKQDIPDNVKKATSNNNNNKEILKEVEKEMSNKVQKEETNLKNDLESKEEQKEEIDNNIYIKLHRSNGNVENLELEEYIVGVVSAEMPASFNKEALKAQSVLARTYALKCLQNGKIITDNSSTQNYKSINELKNMWGISFDTYYNKIVNAVNSTKGEYLSYNGDYIEAVYHSTSNGKTENSINVWGNSFPYLISVESIYDNTNKNFLFSKFFTYEEISNKLERIITSDSIFNIISRNESGRVNNIEIDGINYNGVDFRTLLGLRSTDFDIEKVNDGVFITTKGYGHGVGMSQYGANGMANNGYSYKDILFHYYKGVNISKKN